MAQAKNTFSDLSFNFDAEVDEKLAVKEAAAKEARELEVMRRQARPVVPEGGRGERASRKGGSGGHQIMKRGAIWQISCPLDLREKAIELFLQENGPQDGAYQFVTDGGRKSRVIPIRKENHELMSPEGILAQMAEEPLIRLEANSGLSPDDQKTVLDGRRSMVSYLRVDQLMLLRLDREQARERHQALRNRPEFREAEEVLGTETRLDKALKTRFGEIFGLLKKETPEATIEQMLGVVQQPNVQRLMPASWNLQMRSILAEREQKLGVSSKKAWAQTVMAEIRPEEAGLKAEVTRLHACMGKAIDQEFLWWGPTGFRVAEAMARKTWEASGRPGVNSPFCLTAEFQGDLQYLEDLAQTILDSVTLDRVRVAHPNLKDEKELQNRVEQSERFWTKVVSTMFTCRADGGYPFYWGMECRSRKTPAAIVEQGGEAKEAKPAPIVHDEAVQKGIDRLKKQVGGVMAQVKPTNPLFQRGETLMKRLRKGETGLAKEVRQLSADLKEEMAGIERLRHEQDEASRAQSKAVALDKATLKIEQARKLRGELGAASSPSTNKSGRKSPAKK